MKNQISPFLLLKNEAEEAANFYVSIFKGKLLNITRYPEGGPGPAGSVLTATFEIFGTTFTALNFGNDVDTTIAVSFAIEPVTQEETDYYWNALIADGGEESQCGWLKDKYGFSWQVAPEALPRLMNDKDPKKSTAVMQAMMKMRKIIIKDLENAYNNA